jgi:hypothetical protein
LAVKTRSYLASVRYPLGSFGLLLVVLVGRLADHAYPSSSAHYGRIMPFLARRAIDGIAVVGWTIDRLGDWMFRGVASRDVRRNARAVAPPRKRKPVSAS